MIVYRISHTTSYQYAVSAEACRNLVRLHPRTLPHQACEQIDLRIDPTPTSVSGYVDYFGNRVLSFAIYEPHLKLTVTAESTVVVRRNAAVAEPDRSPPWESVRGGLRTEPTPELVDALDFAFASPYVPVGGSFRDFAKTFFTPGRPLLEAALAMTVAIHRDFRYDPQVTTINTPVAEVLAKRHGVCQDFAHLQLACFRSLGLACRYVSGYLRTDSPPGVERLVGADATHAWVSVYCPASGWVDLDPTNGCLAGERHITLGWGRDFHDVSPLKGVVLGGGKPVLNVAVDVTRTEDHQILRPL